MKTRIKTNLTALTLACLTIACNAENSGKSNNEPPQKNWEARSRVQRESLVSECSEGGKYGTWDICDRFYRQRERYMTMLSVIQNYDFRHPSSRLYKALSAKEFDLLREEMQGVRQNLGQIALAYEHCVKTQECFNPVEIRTQVFGLASAALTTMSESNFVENVGGYIAPLDSIRTCLNDEISPDPRKQLKADLLATVCTTEKGDATLYSDVINTLINDSSHSLVPESVKNDLAVDGLPNFSRYLAKVQRLTKACAAQQELEQLVSSCEPPSRPDDAFYEAVINFSHSDTNRGFEL